MKCLIVKSHPVDDSLCMHFGRHIESRMIDAGHSVVTEDLYAEGFNPCLQEAERNSYYTDKYDVSRFQTQLERLSEAEILVLVFPTWWFGFPAILKGWFDRVWGPGIAFNHSSNFGPITPELHKLQKVLVVTTLGSPWWVDYFMMRRPVKRIIKYGLLGACTNKNELRFLSLYKSELLDEKRIFRFKQKIDKVINRW